MYNSNCFLYGKCEQSNRDFVLQHTLLVLFNKNKSKVMDIAITISIMLSYVY